MKNTLGTSIALTLFGESHGASVGVVIDGIAPGIEIDMDYIYSKLDLRKPRGKISTARVETDEPHIVSGVFEGKTTGTPLCIVMENSNTKSKDYSKTKDLPRPGHADFTAIEKYHGYSDYRGGGHFSGRLTAPIVAAGAIVAKALENKGIYIGTHIKRCQNVSDRGFSDLKADIIKLNSLQFPTLDEAAGTDMVKIIEAVAAEGDSVGGILETAIIGLPSGVGEPWFDSFESVLAYGLFGVPAVKGVEFGAGFAFADMKGSEANDSFYMDGETVKTKTNNNGGINGGITNGMPVVFSTVIKPTSSIFKPQDTVDMAKRENAVLELTGRHDPAIFHRARVVIDSVAALCAADMLCQRFGTDWLR